MNEHFSKSSWKEYLINFHEYWKHRIETSAALTVLGVILLFSTAVLVTLVAPNHVDSTWTSPTSPYQVQMYEMEDPNIYISSASASGSHLQSVRHLKEGFSLLVFKETALLRFVSSPELERYITRQDDKNLKLTSKILLLREPEGEAKKEAEGIISNTIAFLDHSPKKEVDQKTKELVRMQILELYDPDLKEAFVLEEGDGIIQNWVDKNFLLLDEEVKHPRHLDYGVIYSQNPQEYRISSIQVGHIQRWQYNPNGRRIKDLDELKSGQMGFHSRQELIQNGEHIYSIEGCWYCHTDQTRTLIQDVVLNGSDSYPAPPSSANEYIYQKITFAGTRRIGPDLSRVGIKRPSRDWHKGHFWAPKTASAGSIMPAFQHFFDNDPRGTAPGSMGIPNYQFESIYQYMMTKGTRITPPTEAWWLGSDPVKTKQIIEGARQFK